MSEIKDILNWFKTAVPAPTEENLRVQLGCNFEEIGELLATISSNSESNYQDIDDAIDKIVYLADEFKNNGNSLGNFAFYGGFYVTDKTELLDALCDQIVTAIGVAYMLGMDINGALKEVIASNNSKFESGKAIFDDNGKIKKGKDYFKPKLGKFVE